ncbi:MAG: hypothetical protein NC453_27670 [Muribaculum sp.]|nr:hypothetical protein [Muribaculum sp.]
MSAIILLIFILFAGLIAACNPQPKLSPELSEIDRLTWTDPDSAYSAISRFDESLLKNGRDSAMYRLLWAELRDKTYHDDTISSNISKAAIYFRIHEDHYNAMRAYYYQGIIDYNAGIYPQAQVALMESLEQAKESRQDNTYYVAKIYWALSCVAQAIGDETREELYARNSYEEFCRLDSGVFIVQSKLWWATTLCQTGNPNKGEIVAKEVYDISAESINLEYAAEALQIMANATLRRGEFEAAKAYYTILLNQYDYNMSNDDLNLFLWTLTETSSPKDSIEMVYGKIMETGNQDDITYEYYLQKGDYQNATLSLLNELENAQEKFGMRLKNDTGLAIDNWHNEKMVEAHTAVKSSQERTIWIIVTSLLCVTLCIVLWMMTKVRMSRKIDRLLREAILLRDERDRLRVRETELNTEIDKYRGEVIDYRSRLELKKSKSPSSNALDLWFLKINDLYQKYYLTATSAQGKRELVSVIEKEMEYIRSDKELLIELERHIDSSNNNVLSKLYKSLSRITSDQRRLTVFLYFGFSIEAICAIFNITPDQFYNRKARLLAHLNKSAAENKDIFIRKISGRN